SRRDAAPTGSLRDFHGKASASGFPAAGTMIKAVNSITTTTTTTTETPKAFPKRLVQLLNERFPSNLQEGER
ncbi:hypothetical protein, partial [uncultured Lamprocystis sp.]